MTFTTYHVTASAGAHNLFFGNDLSDGWPITYAGTVASGSTVFYDPHAQGMAHLFFVHAQTATGSSIGPRGNTELSAGSGLLSRAPGSPANFGRQVAWWRNGSGIPTQENE